MTSTFICAGCRTLLKYPGGSCLVSCSECGVVSNVVSSEVQKVQIACIGCKGVLQFPIETQIGTCPICSAVFQIQTNNLTSPRENGGDTPTEPPKRPTTASTRTASKIDSAHENSKPEAGEFLSSATINDGVVEECTRLAEEFNEVTAIHDAKIKAKKQRQYID